MAQTWLKAEGRLADVGYCDNDKSVSVWSVARCHHMLTRQRGEVLQTISDKRDSSSLPVWKSQECFAAPQPCR